LFTGDSKPVPPHPPPKFLSIAFFVAASQSVFDVDDGGVDNEVDDRRGLSLSLFSSPSTLVWEN
jgi:hypothetical protein